MNSLEHLGHLRYRCHTCRTIVTGTIAALAHTVKCRRQP